MLRFWKKEGLLVAINQKPRRLTGSPYFHEQFMDEARRQGRQVVFWERIKNPDLVFVNDWTIDLPRLDNFRKMGIKVVLRIDGAGIKDSKNPKKDNIIYQTYEKCDAAIFQSQFCKQIWLRCFKLDKPHTVILNGADENIFSPLGPAENFGFRHFMVTAARWRPWKNLEQMIEVFLRLEQKDLGLVVIGADAKVPPHPRIKATGKLSHRQMAKVFRAADLFLYLPWQDWCPKVVSQALVAGLPVVCSFKGGTRELVQDCGLVIRGTRDEAVPFEPNPVNTEEAVAAVKQILQKGERCRPRPDLYLSSMVKQYYNFFEELLAGRLK
jgi:glycosyltransferase involved in cell wall biosynthesis